MKRNTVPGSSQGESNGVRGTSDFGVTLSDQWAVGFILQNPPDTIFSNQFINCSQEDFKNNCFGQVLFF